MFEVSSLTRRLGSSTIATRAFVVLMKKVRVTTPWIACLTTLLAGSPVAHAQQPASGEPVQVSVSGSVRSRVETLSGRMSGEAPASDHFLSLLTLLKAEADFGGMSLVGEIQDSRRLSGPLTGAAPNEVDTLEPIQAYVSWALSDPEQAGDSLGLELGRFTMDVGSRRLTARSHFKNQKTSFDGLRLLWRSGELGEVIAFRVSPVIRQPFETSAAASNKPKLNQSHEASVFSGAHLRRVLTDGVSGEGYDIWAAPVQGAGNKAGRFRPGVGSSVRPFQGDHLACGHVRSGDKRSDESRGDRPHLRDPDLAQSVPSL